MRTNFAICVDNSEYPASLELHKIYQALPDEDAERDGDLRVIDESGEDYLFCAKCFVRLDVPEETEHLLVDSFARGLQPASRTTMRSIARRRGRTASNRDPLCGQPGGAIRTGGVWHCLQIGTLIVADGSARTSVSFASSAAAAPKMRSCNTTPPTSRW